MNFLIICSSPYGTSTFSRISKNVIDFLSKDEKNSLYCLSLGEEIARSYENVQLSPVVDFEKQLTEAIAYSDPDVVITIGDVVDFFPVLYAKNLQSHHWKWIGIFDILTMPPPPSVIDVILGMDAQLVYGIGLYRFLSGNSKLNIFYARPGVNGNYFYSLENQEEIVNSFKSKNIFTILSPGSNVENNYKIALFEAFASFSRDKEDVYLYLCDRDGNNYYDPSSLFWKYPWIADKILTKSEKDFKFLENHDLNNLYNSVALTIDLTINSNFSLSILEALSCGGSVLMASSPFNSVEQYPCSEKITPVKSHKILNSLGGENYYVDVWNLVEKLNEKYLEYYSMNSVKICRDEDFREEFSWNKFNTSLKYILNNFMNIKSKDIKSIDL